MFSYGAVGEKRLVEGPSDCPNIIIRHGCDRRQTIGLPAGISAGDGFPITGPGRVACQEGENDKNGYLMYFHSELLRFGKKNFARGHLLATKG